MIECSEILSIWGQEITSSFKKRIHQSKKAIKSLKGRRDVASVNIVKDNKKKLAEVYAHQEIFWQQRSKTLWLREGDQNTKKFHAAAKNRRAINQIRNLRDKNGHTVEWGSGLESLMTDYFFELFKATDTDWGLVNECIQQKVSDDQNALLLAAIVDEELKKLCFICIQTSPQALMG